ncbi:hypothetical protein PG987_010181 [Apiospora arundinis]
MIRSSTVDAKSIITACRDYTDAQAGRCKSLTPGIGCCWNSALPVCMKWMYTDPASFVGFSAYQCVKQGEARSLIAWDSTTSSPGDITTTINQDSPPSTSTADPDKAGGGLDRADKIALGCGIGIGLPATLAALVTCWKALRQR